MCSEDRESFYIPLKTQGHLKTADTSWNFSRSSDDIPLFGIGKIEYPVMKTEDLL